MKSKKLVEKNNNLPLEKKAPIIATTIAFFLAIIKFIV
jgi:hypothetical protein